MNSQINISERGKAENSVHLKLIVIVIIQPVRIKN